MKKHILISVLIVFQALFSCNEKKVSEVGQEKDSVKIAMAQIYGLTGDKSGNLVRIENAIIDAKEKQAEIIVFPETSLFGWVNPEAHHRASPIPGEDSKILCQLAKKYNVFICLGLAEKENDALFDSAMCRFI